MKVTNQPLIADSPVKFIVTGFPEESAIAASIERFYLAGSSVDRNFLIFNTFEEQIFSGNVNDQGKILTFVVTPKAHKFRTEEQKKEEQKI